MKAIGGILLSLLGFCSVALGQSPGLIFNPASGSGAAVLDPNRDGYVSKTTAGFQVNDMTGSEIPYFPVPQYRQEPSSDLSTGPSGGHTDLIEDANGNHSFLYFDGNHVLFRMILEGQSKASKGYSFLFSLTPGTFGAVAGQNPGFDFEVVLETGKRVSIYALNGNSSTRVAEFPVEQHSQKAISYVHSKGVTGFMYDFYVPLQAMKTALAGAGKTFDTDLPMLVATTTVTRAGSGAIGATLSDVGGADDNKFNDPFRALKEAAASKPPVSFDDLGEGGSGFPPKVETTTTPVVRAPILEGTGITVKGMLNEPSPATVWVYVNGVLAGTTAVSDFAWELPGLTLAEGDLVTARAQAGTKEISEFSVGVIVGAEAVPAGACLDVGTSTVSISGQHGGSHRVQVITGVMPRLDQLLAANGGASTANIGMRIYLAGTTTIASNSATPAASMSFLFSSTSLRKNAGDSWQLTVGNGNIGLPTGASYEVALFSASDPTCIGARSVPFSSSVDPAPFNAPVFDLPTYTDAATLVSGTVDAAATLVALYQNGNLITTTTPVGGTWSFPVTLVAGDVLYATARASTGIWTEKSSDVTVTGTPIPVEDSEPPSIVGPYVTGDTEVVGFSGETGGTEIEVFVNGVSVGTTTVDENGNWSLTGIPPLNVGDVLTAVATAPGKAASDPSEPITVLSGLSAIPTIDSELSIASDSITITVGAPGLIRVYVDGIDIGEFYAASPGPYTISSTDLIIGEIGGVPVYADPGYLQGEFYKGAEVTATLTEVGKSESDHSAPKVVVGVDYFSVVLASPGPKMANEPFDVIITARDQNGDIFTDFTGTVTLFSDQVSFTPDSRVTLHFVDGRVVHPVTAQHGAEDVRIRVIDTDDPTVSGISSPFLINNPDVMTLTAINPISKYAGEPEFTMTLTGTNFVLTSLAFFNGDVRSSVFVSPTELQVTIPASDIVAIASNHEITVMNPVPLGTGVPTPPQYFQVLQPPSPAILTVSPISGVQFSTMDVTINGSGFVQGITDVDFGPDITVNSVTVNSSGELVANITINNATVGPRDVSVTNPLAANPTATLPNAFTVLSADFVGYVITLPGQTFFPGTGNAGTPSAQTAGAAFTIQVRAVDGANQVYSSFNGTAVLTASDGSVIPGLTGSFSGGFWNGPVSVTKMTGGLFLTATNAAPGQNQTGDSSPFAVGAGAPAGYVVTSSDVSPLAGDAVTITAQLVDAFGNPVSLAGRTVTWGSTGAGGTLGSATSVTNGSGIATVTFTTSGAPGTAHRVSAADSLGATGLSPLIVTEAPPSTVVATQLVVTLPGETFVAGAGKGGSPANQTAGAPFNLVRIYAVDGANEIDVDYSGLKTISYSGPGGSPSYTTSVFFVNGESVTTLATLLTLAESGVQIVIDDGDLAGESSPFNVLAGPPAGLRLEGPVPDTIAAGELSGTMTVVLVDAYGNTAVAGLGGVAIDLATTSGDGSFWEGGADVPLAGDQATIGPGASSVTFRYSDTAAGTPDLSVSSPGLGGGGKTVTIVGGGISVAGSGSFLSGTDLTRVADGVEAATVTLQLRDVYGNALEQADVDVTFATTLGTLSSSTTTTDANGVATVQLTSTVANQASVTATVDHDGSAGTAQLEVTNGSPVIVAFEAGPAAKLAFVSDAFTGVDAIAAGTMTATDLIVQLQDAFGNPVVVTDASGLTVSLVSASDSGEFRDSGGGALAPEQVTIAQGSSTAAFRYYDERAGTHLLEAQSVGLDDAEQNIEVIPAALDSLVVTLPGETFIAGQGNSGSPVSQTAGEPFHFAVRAVDAFFNVVPGYDGTKTLTFTGPASSANGDLPAFPASVIFEDGEADGLINILTATLYHAETVEITAEEFDGANLVIGGTSSEVTVAASETAAELVLAGAETDLASGMQRAFTVTIVDAYGNTVTSGPESTLTISVVQTGEGTLAGTLVGDATAGVLTVMGTGHVAGEIHLTAAAVAPALTSNALTFEIVAGAPDHIHVRVLDTNDTTGGAQTQTVMAGEPFAALIYFVDSHGNLLTDLNVDFHLTWETTSGTSPNGSAPVLPADGLHSVVNGKLQLPDFVMYAAETERTITARLYDPIDTGNLLYGPAVSDLTYNVIAGAADAGATAVTADPTSITADGASTATVTVRLKDAFGNDTETLGGSVTLATSAGTLLGSLVDNGGGVFTQQLQSTTTVETATLTASLDGQPVADTATVHFAAGIADPAQTTVTAAPTSITADGSSTSAITIQLKDAFGNHTALAGGPVTLATDAGALLATLVDNGGGQYTQQLESATTVGTAILTASLDGTAVTDTATVDFVAGIADPTQTTVTASPTSITADGSSTSTITIQLKDAFGNDTTLVGGPVTLATNAGTLLGSLVNGGGGEYTQQLQSTTTAGAATLTAGLDGSAVADTATVDFVAGPLAGFLVEADGGGAIGEQTAGEPFALRITAVDEHGNVVTGYSGTVDLTVNQHSLVSGGGATGAFVGGVLNGHMVRMDVADAGYEIMATGGGETGTSNDFAVVAGPASAVVTTAVVPDGFVDEPTVITITVTDVFGNPVTGVAGDIEVAISGTNDGAPTTAVIDNGDGTYTVSYTPTSDGTDSIAITLDGTPIDDSPYESVVSGSTGTLTIATQPEATVAGQTIAGPPTVTVLDAEGDPMAGVEVTVTINQNAFAPGSTVTVTTDASGVAVFDNLILETAATGYTLTFSADDFPNEVSDPFEVHSGPADAGASTFTAVPSTVIIGNEVTLTVTLTDAFGNPVATEDAVTIYVTAIDGAPLAEGERILVQAANVDGNGVFTADQLADVVGIYTLTAYVGGEGDFSNPINDQVVTIEYSEGPLAQFGVLGTGGASFPTELMGNLPYEATILALDADGSLIDLNGPHDVVITVQGVATPVTLQFTNGVASHEFTPTELGTDYELEVASNETPGVTGESTAFDVIAGPPDGAMSTIVALTPNVLVGEDAVFEVTLRDAAGNLLEGRLTSLSFYVDDVEPSLAFGDLAETGNGRYTATASAAVPGPITLFAYIGANHGGNVGDPIGSAQAMATLPPSGLELAGPATVAVGLVSGNFTLTVVDAEGNPVPVGANTTFTLATTSGGPAIFNPASVTIPAGASSATFTYTDSVVGTHTLTATPQAPADAGLVGKSGVASIEVTAGAPVASFAGSAILFNGNNQYGEGAMDDAEAFAEALTIEVWLRRDDTDPVPQANETILAKGEDWALRRAGVSGDLEFYTKGVVGTGTLSYGLVASGDFFDAEWNHVVAVYDQEGGTKKVYLNGALVAQETVAGELAKDSNLFRIGANGGSVPADFYAGAINEVRVWNVVRDAGQLEALRLSRLTGGEFGLVHYWRLDEGSGTLVADGGGDANLTLYNGEPWFAPESPNRRVLGIQGLDVELRIGGFDPLGGEITAYVTKLPSQGTLYQMLPNGDRGEAILAEALPVQVTEPFGRILYAAPEMNGTDFDSFEYIVESEGVLSDNVEEVVIDLERADQLGGTALRLDPWAAQYVITPNLRSAFHDNAVTIEIWFKAEGPGVLVTELGQPQIDRGWQNSQLEVVEEGGVPHVRARVWNLPEADANTLVNGVDLGTIAYGEWNHAAVRYNPAARVVDGALNGVVVAGVEGDRLAPWETIIVDAYNQASRPGIFYAFGARDRQHLGSGGPIGQLTNNYFQGDIDEVRIWNAAIPDDRLAAARTHFLEGDWSDLVALYRFDEASGNVVQEARSPAKNATVINGAMRVQSGANLNLAETVRQEQFVVEIPGFHNAAPSMTAWITRMPLFGSLYQYGADGALGPRIANVPAQVTDAKRRVIFVPNEGSYFDSVEYETRHNATVFGPRRLRFRVDRVNELPKIENQNGVMEGAHEGTPFTISYDELKTELDASDPDETAITIRIEQVLIGKLTKNGQPITPSVTTLSPGETVVWTPPPYVNRVNNGGPLDAFRVIAFDGRDYSENTGTVAVDIEPVASAPVATFPGTALRLQGNNQFVYTKNLRPLFREEDLTIEVWFRADGPGVIISERANANRTNWNKSMLEVIGIDETKGRIRAHFYGMSTLVLGEVEWGSWNHAVIRYDKAALIFDGFLNGQWTNERITGDRSAPWESGRTGLFYGFGLADANHLGDGGYFEGQLREIRMWNVARNAGAIRTSYPGSLTGDEIGLAAWYRFSDGAGTGVTDHGPFNQDAGLVNAPEWVTNIPTVRASEQIEITLEGFDPDGTAIEFVISTLPGTGELLQADGTPITVAGTAVAGSHVIYRADEIAGSDSFKYQVRDAGNPARISAEETVTVSVVADAGPMLMRLSEMTDAERADVARVTFAGLVESDRDLIAAYLFGGEDALDLFEEPKEVFRMEFSVERGRPFVVEFSENMVTWTEVHDVWSVLSPDQSRVEGIAEVEAEGGRGFMRVRVDEVSED